MKIDSNKFYFLIIFLLGIMNVFANQRGFELPILRFRIQGPPMPTPPPPPPPGLPIDENTVILMMIALLFGIYIIYNNKIKTKTQM